MNAQVQFKNEAQSTKIGNLPQSKNESLTFWQFKVKTFGNLAHSTTASSTFHQQNNSQVKMFGNLAHYKNESSTFRQYNNLQVEMFGNLAHLKTASSTFSR